MRENGSRNRINFEAFGVRIEVNSNDSELLTKIRKILPQVVPVDLNFQTGAKVEHIFDLKRDKSSGKIIFSKNGGEISSYGNEDRLIEFLSSRIRITVAEFAESKVFIHAGAVGWKGSGIIIPGRSYSGKTTLVSELIKYGAEYYSDEYAVLDERGFLHPYPKMLSMRGIIDDYSQVDTLPEVFGAKIGKESIPVKLVLITEFQKESFWDPQVLKSGEGVMEILQHTIPIRFKPEFVLRVLKKTFSRAIIAKSKRGEARLSIPLIIDLFETVCK